MENKTTTELLDSLSRLSEEKGDWAAGGKYEQIMNVLKTREPFTDLLNEDYDESLPSAWEAIRDLQEEIKKLKRHKHDPKTGDVMIRI
jgi:predicted AlkP superfamily phosphohydrolase/phosphomutase